jgi:hypothetical protein
LDLLGELASLRAQRRQRWHGAVRAHAATAQQFAAYECTPAGVAQIPCRWYSVEEPEGHGCSTRPCET